jgi:hypothetical protein
MNLLYNIAGLVEMSPPPKIATPFTRLAMGERVVVAVGRNLAMGER